MDFFVQHASKNAIRTESSERKMLSYELPSRLLADQDSAVVGLIPRVENAALEKANVKIFDYNHSIKQRRPSMRTNQVRN